MKRGMQIILSLITFLLCIGTAKAQEFSVESLLANQWFNAAMLFLLIFIICYVALKRVFQNPRNQANRSGMGLTIIISLVLGIAGSFSVIAKFGNIFQKFDWWIILVIFILILIITFALSKNKRASKIMLLFIIPLAWFIIGKDLLCPPKGVFSPTNCTIINVLMYILIIIAIILFLRALFKKSKEMGGWKQGIMEREPKEKKPRQPIKRRKWKWPKWRRKPKQPRPRPQPQPLPKPQPALPPGRKMKALPYYRKPPVPVVVRGPKPSSQKALPYNKQMKAINAPYQILPAPRKALPPGRKALPPGRKALPNLQKALPPGKKMLALPPGKKLKALPGPKKRKALKYKKK